MDLYSNEKKKNLCVVFFCFLIFINFLYRLFDIMDFGR